MITDADRCCLRSRTLPMQRRSKRMAALTKMSKKTFSSHLPISYRRPESATQVRRSRHSISSASTDKQLARSTEYFLRCEMACRHWLVSFAILACSSQLPPYQSHRHFQHALCRNQYENAAKHSRASPPSRNGVPDAAIAGASARFHFPGSANRVRYGFLSRHRVAVSGLLRPCPQACGRVRQIDRARCARYQHRSV